MRSTWPRQCPLEQPYGLLQLSNYRPHVARYIYLLGCCVPLQAIIYPAVAPGHTYIGSSYLYHKSLAASSPHSGTRVSSEGRGIPIPVAGLPGLATVRRYCPARNSGTGLILHLTGLSVLASAVAQFRSPTSCQATMPGTSCSSDCCLGSESARQCIL